MTGASSVILVLVLGVVIVNITAGIIVFLICYEESPQELGLYGMLGLDVISLL